MLNFDATDGPVHGRQEGRFFHGNYDLPSVTVRVLRRPVRLGDSVSAGELPAPGLAAGENSLPRRQRIPPPADTAWCERNGVDYLGGIAGNATLNLEDSKTVMAADADADAWR